MKFNMERDPKYIKSLFTTKDNKRYCKNTCRVEFPAWYLNKELGDIEGSMCFYGVVAIIVGDKYCVSIVPTMLYSNPINTKVITRNDMEYIQLEYGPDDEVLVNNTVIKNAMTTYQMFDNYILMPKAPWYLDYLDFLKVFMKLSEYAGSGVGDDYIANELMVQYIARNPNNYQEFYRQTKMDVPPAFVGLMDMTASVRDIIGKISESHVQEGITSALTTKDAPVTRLEKYLKDDL